MIVTIDNIETARESCAALDQRAELAPGCETWPIYTQGQRGQMTVWPDAGRAAVCWGADSAYGDWDAETRTLTLGTGEVVHDAGEVMPA